MTIPRASASRVNDRLLVAIAALGIAVTLAAAVVGALGVLPDTVTVVVVLAGMSIALRFALLLRARTSSGYSTARVMRVVSTASIAVAAIAALATLAVTFADGESGWAFLDDLGLQAWALLILVIAASPVRTATWSALLGMGLAGFLAVSALAKLVGAPVVEAWGADSFVAGSLWVPFTEETLKALPVAAVALIAAHSRVARPSAIDITLLGAFSGAGFALIENAEYHRVFGDWNAAPPLSFIFPTMAKGYYDGPIDAVASHLVWTALFSMGIGFGVLYFRRFRFAWVAIPATFAVVVLEHGMTNAQVPVVLGGIASPVILILGFVALLWFERRGTRGHSGFRQGLWLNRENISFRRAGLSRIQSRPADVITDPRHVSGENS